MSQLDRHLTTEQLSALLDNQLEETGETYRGHLASCQQCQQELAELRQTVNLLRALPQPTLPRSFVLPSGTTQTGPEHPNAQLEPNIHVLRSTNSSLQRARARSSTGRRVLSLAGTLAAVVGILFVLSGFVPSLPQMGMATSSTSTGGSSVSAGAPSNNSAASSANGSVNSATSSGSAESQNGTQAQPRDVQAPAPTQPQNIAGIQPAQKQETEQSAAPPTAAPFFDWGATGMRIGLGILLFIAGMMGIAIGRERNKKART